MSTAIMKGDIMSKKISITRKRQLTIPKKYFDMLGFGNEAKCEIKNNSLIITPVKEKDSYFASNILEDLVTQGYEGKELVEKFNLYQRKIGIGIQNMIDEADKIADDATGYESFEDLFGTGD